MHDEVFINSDNPLNMTKIYKEENYILAFGFEHELKDEIGHLYFRYKTTSYGPDNDKRSKTKIDLKKCSESPQWETIKK